MTYQVAWQTMDHRTPTPVIQPDREQVRILVQSIGYTETAQRTGIKRWTLYKWGQRYGWKSPIEHAQARTVQSVQPAHAHAEALAEHEAATRMSLAKSARRMAKDCEELPVRHADKAYVV